MQFGSGSPVGRAFVRSARPGGGGMDILIIEDDPMICQTIRNAWPTPGDKLNTVSSYSQSLRLTLGPELAFFDAIVVDLHLPDGDGLSVLRSIRQSSSVPIVVISGSGTAESRAGTFDIGADDYVMKPFSVRSCKRASPGWSPCARTRAPPA